MKTMTKRLLWAAALVLLAAVLVLVNMPKKHAMIPGTEVSEEMPDFTARCLDGSSFHLQEQRGKVVVINIWATWCAPCVKELPSFDRLQREYPEEVAVLALHSRPVTADVPDYLSAFTYIISFAVDEDGSLGEVLNISAVLPQTVIISPEGIVTYNQSGSLGYEKLLELVNDAKAVIK